MRQQDTAIDFLAPIIRPECEQIEKDVVAGRTHPNTDYQFNPCWHVHRAILLGMSEWECDMNVRVIMSLACGSLIGFERRRDCERDAKCDDEL